MVNYQPDDFGESPSEQNNAVSPVEQCPHCGKAIEGTSAICPHCNLPVDELIQVDLHPEFPRQRLHRLLQPRNIIAAVATVALALGVYGFFVIQRFSSDYYITAGDRSMTEGNNAAAVEYYQQAVRFGPQNPEAYEKLGWAEYQLTRDADALKHFENALSLNPGQMLSLYGAGLSAYRLRDYENAISHLNRFIDIVPRYAGAYEYLGLAEYRLGNYEAAYAYLNEAWVYNPQNATTLYYLGRILALRGEASLAIENFNQAGELGFDPGSVAYARGLAQMQAGSYEFARDDLQKALTAFPTRKDVTLALAKSFYLLEDYSAARDQLTTIQSNVPLPYQPDYLALSGWVSLRQGNTAAALDAFNQWLNLNPNNAEALNALGWATYYSGNCQTANIYFQKTSQPAKDEWIVTNDSLNTADETPQAGLELQCQ
ncbi:MAG: tetratricopeptide repeat protein [Chloroflexi bacterium]|nr:tetratricopeptide repeat protein [Chloroflexota bacterium]